MSELNRTLSRSCQTSCFHKPCFDWILTGYQCKHNDFAHQLLLSNLNIHVFLSRRMLFKFYIREFIASRVGSARDRQFVFITKRYEFSQAFYTICMRQMQKNNQLTFSSGSVLPLPRNLC